MGGRQAVSACRGRGFSVLDFQDTGHRLLLEPFTDVALVSVGARRQFGRCHGAGLGKRPIEAESLTDIDAEHFQGALGRLAQPLDESVSLLGNVRLCHRLLNRSAGVSRKRNPYWPAWVKS